MIRENTLKKILKTKNIYRKNVNNQTTFTHKILFNLHRLSKGWDIKNLASIYQDLLPVYAELDKEFQTIDVVDLIYYERWLNV